MVIEYFLNTIESSYGNQVIIFWDEWGKKQIMYLQVK
jgi:hypothetical protein